MPLNETRAPTIKIDCGCGRRRERCSACDGVGVITKKSCTWCGGTGKDAIGSPRPCQQCRGQGYMSNTNLDEGTRFV